MAFQLPVLVINYFLFVFGTRLLDKALYQNNEQYSEIKMNKEK